MANRLAKNMAGNFSWTCPYCNRPTTVTGEDYQRFSETLYKDTADGGRHLAGIFIVCPNPECKKLTLTLGMYEAVSVRGSTTTTDNKLKSWALLPSSKAKAFPSYVPQPIIQDYDEACLILEGSPKASATLSRRCLQGMIRNFWNIKKPDNHKGLWSLKDEIETIKDKVEPDTWAAIDGVRKIGNIGAHMEQDINVIVDVDPDEAEKLIWLIELLIKDWYINKHERQAKLLQITAAADGKSTKKPSKS